MSLGPYHDELYQQVLPLHGPDPGGLAQDLVGAWAHGVIEVDDLVRDTPEGPGWGVILDVDLAPVKGLRWLAQLAGVQLRDPKLLDPPVNLIKTPIPALGNPGATSESGSVNALMTGTGKFGPFIITAEKTLFDPFYVAWDGAPTSGEEINGGADATIVVPFAKYTFAIDIIETTDPVYASILWADVDGLAISQTDGDYDTTTGRRVVQGTAPAGAVNAWPIVTLDTADDARHFYAEGAVFEAGWTDGVFFTADTVSPRLETSQEWATYARSAIREQGAKRRGTPRAILNAVRDTLTGTRYANLLERVGGNAYALTLITRPSETPDAAATYAAALTQKPLGMKLTHTLTEGVIIDEGTKSIDTSTATIDTATLADVAD